MRFKFSILALIMSVYTALADEPLYSPTSFTFQDTIEHSQLRLFNNGPSPLVWTTKIMRWDLDDEGADHFFETSDFLIDEQTIELPPKSGRTVSIRANGARAGEAEKSYRLFLMTEREEDSGFLVTHNHTLPIFLASTRQSVSRSLQSISTSPNSMKISVSNNGSDHTYLENITVRGADNHGETVYEVDDSGWYILPGRTRTYQLTLSEVDCFSQSQIQVKAKFRDGTEISDDNAFRPTCGSVATMKTGFRHDDKAL